MGCVRAKIGLTGQLDRRKPGNYFKPCVHTFQREMCHGDTFRLLFKTLLKELFTDKGEILSCKSVKPCKNRKNSQEYNARTRDKSGSNSPPFKGNVQVNLRSGSIFRCARWNIQAGRAKRKIEPDTILLRNVYRPPFWLIDIQQNSQSKLLCLARSSVSNFP